MFSIDMIFFFECDNLFRLHCMFCLQLLMGVVSGCRGEHIVLCFLERVMTSYWRCQCLVCMVFHCIILLGAEALMIFFLKASRDILRLMHHTYRGQGFQLFFSFFEIYGGKLFDLLNDRKKLCMREDGKQQVCIVGLQEYRVSDVETIKELIDRGNSTRSSGTTGANEESSRSHAILQLPSRGLSGFLR